MTCSAENGPVVQSGFCFKKLPARMKSSRRAQDEACERGKNMNMIWFWLALTVVMLIAELATTALVSLWFVGGGICALILAALHLPLWIQIAGFAGVSILLFCTCREWLESHFHPTPIATNTNRLIGAIGTVTQPIDPISGGRVLVFGQDWKAMPVDGKPIAENELIKVTDIKGVKLIVMHVPKEAVQ